MASKYINSSEILEERRIARATFYRWIDNGKFPAPEKTKRNHRWLRTEIEEYFKTVKLPVYVRKEGKS